MIGSARRLRADLAAHTRDAVKLSAGRPAIALGVRAALATMMPILVGLIFHWDGARWATIAGFNAALVDKGGAYRTRLWAMSSVTIGSALALLVSGYATSAWSGALLMLVAATLGGLLRVLGPEMSSVGTASSVMLAIALEVHPALSQLWPACGAVLAGGAWAVLLSMLLWPVRVYRPARRAVARSFDQLAAHARAMADELEHGTEDSWRAMLQRDHRALRERLEEARAVLGATRRGNRGESGRGARLLALFSIAEQTMGGLVGLADGLEECDDRATIIERLRATAAALAQVATEVQSETRLPPNRTALARDAHPRDATAVLFSRIGRWLELAGEITRTLHDEAPPPPSSSGQLGGAFASESALANVRSIFSFDSMILRHAARLGVTASLAVLLAHALRLQRGYWVTLTVLIVLQPYTPETFRKGVQRILGTVGGAMVAALAVGLLRDPSIILLFAGILAAASVSVLQLNYALFAFFLTPTFVLLAEPSGGDFRLVGLRILNTLIGGGLAFIGARIFWPMSENRLFPTEMAAALMRARQLFEVAVAAPDSPQLLEARRRFGIAINNADASFQRLLAEAGTAPVDMEPRMTLLLFARRFCGSTVRMAALGAVTAGSPFAIAVEHALDALITAVAEGTAPGPLPSPETTPMNEPGLERIALQLRVLHDAATRLAM